MQHKHLTLDERITIQHELNNGSSFKAIGRQLGRDCTTISKEVKKHRVLDNSGGYGKAFNDCKLSFLRQCKSRHVCQQCLSRSKRYCWSCGKCTDCCPLYESYSCSKLIKAPYVCNSCSALHSCTLQKAFYKAASAQDSYKDLLSSSRSGITILPNEQEHLDRLLSPLIRKGQSIHHIAVNHKAEIMLSEKTLYSYVNAGLFQARNIDMPRVVRMRRRKGKKRALKVDSKCRVARTFEDYNIFIQAHPDLPVQQIDSVEGVKGGPVLLTIHFPKQELQLAFKREANDAKSVSDIFEHLYTALGPDIFQSLFPVLLADNGAEFSDPTSLEFDDQGNRRAHVFYCDPSAPYQKGSCENNHELIRRCLPKSTDIAQYSQQQISTMMDHINSYARPNLGDKSPYDVFAFQYGRHVLDVLGVKKISPDEITLTPDVFRCE